MSRRGGYQAGAAVLGVLAAIGVVVAAVTIGVAESWAAEPRRLAVRRACSTRAWPAPRRRLPTR